MPHAGNKVERVCAPMTELVLDKDGVIGEYPKSAADDRRPSAAPPRRPRKVT